MSGEWHEGITFTTPPNTPERMREVEQITARGIQAAVDQFQLHMRDVAEEARRFHDGIELVEGVELT